MNAYAATPEAFPALVLNADFRPLSYYPLSLWSWQESVKAVFLERVNIVSEYDRFVRSPSFEMRLPSVVSLKTYVRIEAKRSCSGADQPARASSRLQLGIPIKVVEPALVQVVGREQPPVAVQLEHRRAVGVLPRLHARVLG